MREPTIWVPTRSDTNRAVQSQKMVRGWKFWIEKVEDLYYLCSKSKGADQLIQLRFTVTAKLICAFVFAYADCWFSHAEAHLQEMFHPIQNLLYLPPQNNNMCKCTVSGVL